MLGLFPCSRVISLFKPYLKPHILLRDRFPPDAEIYPTVSIFTNNVPIFSHFSAGESSMFYFSKHLFTFAALTSLLLFIVKVTFPGSEYREIACKLDRKKKSIASMERFCLTIFKLSIETGTRFI